MPLILSRHQDETIIIETPEGQISITVTRIDRNRACLMVQAPQSMSVWRKERLTQDKVPKVQSGTTT